MANSINTFSNSALNLIKSTIKNANDLMQSFSLNDIDKAINEAKSRFKSEFDRFKSQIKNYKDKFAIDIEFNKNTDVLSYSVEGNSLSVTVNSKDGSRHSSYVYDLPEDVNTSEIIQSYDSELHRLTFKFPKNTSNA